MAVTRPRPAAGARPTRTPRVTRQGDIAASLTKKGMQAHVVGEAREAATTAKLIAVKDILDQQSKRNPAKAANALRAVLAGAAPDDVLAIRKMLAARAW